MMVDDADGERSMSPYLKLRGQLIVANYLLDNAFRIL